MISVLIGVLIIKEYKFVESTREFIDHQWTIFGAVIGAIFGGVITSAPRRNMAALRRLSEGGS